ncbi:forkhead box protein P2 isoform X2 [Chironomus tepperi]|uniref:forkhead box protein P2 isoform X2 n=1 Tax=Chironomus tepperi TaxID=113505 RepID=UPI00391F6367
MGCGQSKKIHLYPRKNKSKSNGKKGHDSGDDEEENTEEKDEQQQHKEKEKIDEELQLSEGSSPEPNSNEVMIPILKKNGPLLQSQEISTSQQNFFKMLDQKIEQGPDYDSNSETEIALEEARLNSLVQHWESASLSASMCSSTSRSLQNTPVRSAPLTRQQLRSQFQQPLSAELLTQQQMIKQLQQHQANQAAAVAASGNISINSPKRIELNPSNRQQLLTQTIIHQTYGVQPQQTLQQAHILAQYQQQQQQNIQLRQLSGSSVIPSSNYSPPIPGATNIPQATANRNIACLQMSYFPTQPNAVPLYGGDAVHSQVQQPQEPRFPHAISVNRLAPQVQRQLRETQELIKADCPPMYQGAYQTTANASLRSQTRTGLRRPTLETQYSVGNSELS